MRGLVPLTSASFKGQLHMFITEVNTMSSANSDSVVIFAIKDNSFAILRRHSFKIMKHIQVCKNKEEGKCEGKGK